MPLRRPLFYISLAVSMTCLIAGLALVGQSFLAVLSFLPGIALLLAPQLPAARLTGLSLFGAVILAALGLLAHASPYLMIPAAAASLAAWDLAHFNREAANEVSGNFQFEQRHLQSLGLALGVALVLVFAGRTLRLQLPFLWIVLLVLISLFALDRVIKYLQER